MTLKPNQQAAVGALLRGLTVTDAAAEAGVARETVHRWLREDHHFRAAVNRGQIALQRELELSLLDVLARASRVVSDAVDQGDVQTALSVLRASGCLKGLHAVELSDDAVVLAQEDKLAEDERREDRISRSLGLHGW
ncbi:hypothetical protein GF314_17680 [bacterium]|nr:hypothetical protein [bacterium]